MHCQSSEGLVSKMELHHAPEINGADYIDVVQKKWFVGISGIVQEKMGGFFQSSPGIE